MSFLKFYNEEIITLAKKNVQEVMKTADDYISNIENKNIKDLVKKVKNRLKRWGSTSGEIDIIKKISKDYDFAVEYAKQPSKQNVSEKMQYKFLKQKGFELSKLPTSGKNSIRFKDGSFTYGNDEKNPDTKSFDFVYNETIYIYNKLTTGGFDDVDMSIVDGGGQKNQFVDAINFLKQANLYCEKNKNNFRFVLIVDGDYYTEDKIEILNYYSSDRVKITNCDEFEKCVRPILHN